MLLRIRSTRTLSIAKAAHMPCGQRKAGQERAHAGSPVGSAGLLVCRPRLGPSHAPTMQQMVAPAVAQQNSASGGEGEPGPRSPVAPLRNSSDMSSHTTRTPPRSNSLRRGRVSSGQECGTDQAARRAARLPCGGQAGWRKRSRGRGRGAGTCGGQQAAAAQWRSARTHKPKLSAPPPPCCSPAPPATRSHLSVPAGCAVAAAPSSMANSYWKPLQPPPSTVTRSATGPPDCAQHGGRCRLCGAARGAEGCRVDQAVLAALCLISPLQMLVLSRGLHHAALQAPSLLAEAAIARRNKHSRKAMTNSPVPAAL